jgi:hypothetical protein
MECSCDDEDFCLSDIDELPHPIEINHDEKVVSPQPEEEDEKPRGRIPHGPNSTPKGEGKDSRKASPDPADFYNYQGESIAFRHLQALGYEGIIQGSLWKVMDKVQECAVKTGIAMSLTRRNRMARRRKPCAFHWLDENWCLLEEIFKTAVQEVLGDTSGLNPRGRPKL